MPQNTTFSRADIPTPALLLGIGGLIPFVTLSIAIWLLDGDLAEFAKRALVAYAAVILSFLGGVHWGVGTVSPALTDEPAPAGGPSTGLFLVSVLPALAAWPAALLDAPVAFAALAATFLALLAFDLSIVRSGHLPRWYARLRVGLTTVVVISLGLAAFAALR